MKKKYLVVLHYWFDSVSEELVAVRIEDASSVEDAHMQATQALNIEDPRRQILESRVVALDAIAVGNVWSTPD
jgi:hypothetical protein